MTPIRPLLKLSGVPGIIVLALAFAPIELVAQEQPLGEVFRRVIQVFGVQPGAVEVQVEEAEVAADEAPAENEEMKKEQEEELREQWKQLEVHFTQQFRPMLSGHMNLVKQSAQPSDEQTKKLQRRGREALKVSVTAMVECQKKMQTGRWDPQTDKQPDPQGIFNTEILKITREELSPEQFQRLDLAMQQREASRKRAAILCLLAKMDHDLYLSREQRDKMAEVLDKNWNPSWHRNLQFYLHDNGSNYPNIPNEPLAAVLTERQRQVWAQFPKVDLSNWGWGGFLAGLVGNPEPEAPEENDKENDNKKEDGEDRENRTEEKVNVEKGKEEKVKDERKEGQPKAEAKPEAKVEIKAEGKEQAADKPVAEVAVVAQIQLVAPAVAVAKLEVAPERFVADDINEDEDDVMVVDEMFLERPFDGQGWFEVHEAPLYQDVIAQLSIDLGMLVGGVVRRIAGEDQVQIKYHAVVDGNFVPVEDEDVEGAALDEFVIFEPEGPQDQQQDEEEEDAGMDAQQQAIARAQAVFEIGVENFDMWVYNNTGGREQAKKRIDDQLQVFIDSMRKFFTLNEDQLRKLELYGRGDVQRFQQQVERVRARFMLVRKDQQKFNEIWTDIGPLQQRLQQGFFNEQSLLAKSMPVILNEEQLKQYENWQADRRKFHYLAKIELIIAEMASYTPFTNEQREKLVQLVADSGPPPRKRGQFDYIYVMYQMSQVPDAKLQATINKEQLELMNKLRNQGRQYQNYLKQNQVID